jgi:hypothetical protein
VLLGIFYALIGAALALLGLGVLRDDSSYWFAAAALLIVGFALFRDMSAPGRNPIREWLSTKPLGVRVRGIREEAGELLDELAREKASTANDDDPPSADVQDEGAKTRGRTWTFEFRWPPKRRDS